MSIPSAIVQYKSRDFSSINAFLRSGYIPTGETESSMRAKVTAISGAMQTGLPVPDGSFLYRGTDFSEFGKHTLLGVQKMCGKTFRWKSFVSTSIDKNAAYKFIGGGERGLLLRIQPSPTTSFYDMSNASAEQKRELKNLTNEKEILLNCGTRCKIVRIVPAEEPIRAKKYHIVTVRLL